jgi:vacuolar-type H+-ATPase subunit E/Vma4
VSLERLKQEIIGEADQRANDLSGKYKNQLQAEQSRIQQQASLVEESIIQAAQQQGDQEASRLRQTRQLEAKAKVLAAKQAELNYIRVTLINEILHWDTKKTKELLTSLLKDLPKEQGQIKAGEKHAESLKKMLTNSKIKLNKSSIKDDGGFIFTTKDMEINFTVRELVNQLFERHKAEIARSLFS